MEIWEPYVMVRLYGLEGLASRVIDLGLRVWILALSPPTQAVGTFICMTGHIMHVYVYACFPVYIDVYCVYVCVYIYTHT